MTNGTRPWLGLCVAALIAAGAAPEAQAVTIDFETVVSPGDWVTNQFPDATFSGITGIEVSHVEVIGPPVLFANFVRTTPTLGYIPPGGDPLFVDFTAPVNDLTFALVGAEYATGTIVNVVVFHDAGTTNVPVASNGVGSFHKRTINDIAGFGNVTRIELHTQWSDNHPPLGEPLGVGWDDFTFTPNPPCNSNGYFECIGKYPGDWIDNSDQCGWNAAPQCGGTAPDSCTLKCISSTPVPTLSPWGLILLGMALPVATFLVIRLRGLPGSARARS